jgi:probable F420-dependent oxidoreductase
VAASTTKIRIATGIVIAPLRPAPVFAKSVATLDALSHGRLDLGVGAGWQRAEFEAAGIPFESRFARMDDTLNACLRLWQGGPVDFESATSSFHQVWCHPVPAQPGGPPIWFGGGTVGANARRIATLGSGWLPPGGATSEHVSAGVAGLRRYFTERGRDPAELRIRAVLPVRLGAAGPDLEATIATIPDFAAAGATTVVLPLAAFARTFEDVGLILRRFSEA